VKHLIQFVTFLAFLTSVMIPAGFMPQALADGAGVKIVICSGMDQNTIVAAQDGQPVDEHAPKKPCVYATVLSAHEPAAPQLVSQPEFFAISSANIFPAAPSLRRFLFILPDATGPPAVL